MSGGNISKIQLPSGNVYNIKDETGTYLPLTGGTVTGVTNFENTVELDYFSSRHSVSDDNGSYLIMQGWNDEDGIRIGYAKPGAMTGLEILANSSGNASVSLNGVRTPINDDEAANKLYVDTVISNLPEPMIFKGSVGTDGTVTWANLATAASANEGFTYKVITDHTAETGKPAAKVGDTIISTGSEWVVIPSGDEPSGTVTSVGISNATNGGLSISGSPITSSGSITIGHSNVLGSAQTTSAVYPIKIDKNGHISEYGSAVNISDENVKQTPISDTSDIAYGLVTSSGSGSTETTNYVRTTDRIYIVNSTPSIIVGKSTDTQRLSIRPDRVAFIYNSGNFQGYLKASTITTADKTWTLPNATGTVALTSDITDEKVKTGIASENTNYYFTLDSSTSTGPRTKYTDNNLSYKFTNGTSSAVGVSVLNIGNDNNYLPYSVKGQLRLYGQQYSVYVDPGTPSSTRTLTCPNDSGTIALTSDIESNIEYFTYYDDPGTWADSIIENIVTAYNAGKEIIVIRKEDSSATEERLLPLTYFNVDDSDPDDIIYEFYFGSVGNSTGTYDTYGLYVSGDYVESTTTWSFIEAITDHDSFASLSHTHGNITATGSLQTTDVDIASGDKLVVTDSSNSNKVARTSLSFDGSTTNQYLSKKGTWENTPDISGIVSDDKTWNGVALGSGRTDSASGLWVPAKDNNNLSGTAYWIYVTEDIPDNVYSVNIPRYKKIDNVPYLVSSTPSTNDNSTKVATTAYVDGGYLKLSGGSVTGPVTFGDTISIDDATMGTLVVTGGASFVNTISGSVTGSSGSSKPILLSNEDLNDIHPDETTWYYAVGSHSITNGPSDLSSNGFGMVVHRTAGGYREQVINRYDGIKYSRYYSGSSWSEWKTWALADTKSTQYNTTGSAEYRVLFSNGANDIEETAGVRKNTNMRYNPSQGSLKVKGFDSISRNFKSINCDVSKTEIQAQDNTLTTSSADSDWFKALVKAICIKYPNETNTLFRGYFQPNSSRIYEILIYDTSDVDGTTKLPQHCYGFTIQYGGGVNKFGTDSYTWRFGAVNTNTTYSAGTGLSLSSTTINHSNSVTAQTTQAIYPIKIDAQGHISAYGSAVTPLTASSTLDATKLSGTIPSSCYTDTNNKVTQGATTTSSWRKLLTHNTATTQGADVPADVTSTVYACKKLEVQPSTGLLSAGGYIGPGSVEYIKGTQSESTNAWTGTTKETALYDGKMIMYVLPYAGTSTGATLNLTLAGGSTTGAKSIYRYGNTTAITTHFGANSRILLIYDSNNTRWNVSNYYDSNTYTSAYCTTGASTAAKAASCTDYALLSKSYILVTIKNSNTSATALTLNINSKGAKPIYINGSASSSSNYTLNAGTYLVYYNGTNYYFRNDGKITGDITGSAAKVGGHTVTVSSSFPSGGSDGDIWFYTG